MPARYTLGIDIGGTTTTLAVADAHNHVVAADELPTDAARGAEDLLARVASAAAALTRRYPCAAAGAGVAAYVARDTGTVTASPNLDFTDVPWRRLLGEALGLPAVVTNDVNAAAFGEYAVAAGREPFVAVFAGTGVGAGVIWGAEIFAGAEGYAAEIGHVPVAGADGELCGCGRRGCLEAYAGGRGIVRRANARARAGRDAFATVDDVVAAARDDASLDTLLREAAAYLGAGLAAAVNLFNPGTLVLGGGVLGAWPPLYEKALTVLRTRALAPSLANLETRRSALGARAGAVGAAALARKTSAES